MGGNAVQAVRSRLCCAGCTEQAVLRGSRAWGAMLMSSAMCLRRTFVSRCWGMGRQRSEANDRKHQQLRTSSVGIHIWQCRIGLR